MTTMLRLLIEASFLDFHGSNLPNMFAKLLCGLIFFKMVMMMMMLIIGESDEDDLDDDYYIMAIYKFIEKFRFNK